MAACKHCGGTGEAPEVLTLECIGCQRPVKVKLRGEENIIRLCVNIRCRECKQEQTNG